MSEHGDEIVRKCYLGGVWTLAAGAIQATQDRDKMYSGVGLQTYGLNLTAKLGETQATHQVLGLSVQS
jgi:hypothetical protein